MRSELHGQVRHPSAPTVGGSRRWLHDLVFAVPLFLTTLQSFYLHDLGGPFLVVAGWILIVALATVQFARCGLSAIPNWYVRVCAASAAIAALVHWLYSGDSKGSLGLLTSTMMLIAVPVALAGQKLRFERSISLVLIAHLLLLAVQVGYFYYFRGRYLDFISIVGRESIWWSGKAFEVFGHRIPRFTGVYNEPATQAGTIAALTATRYALNRRADAIFWLGSTTLFATASMTGTVLGLGLVASAAFDFARQKRFTVGVRHLVAIATLAAVGGAFALQRLQIRLSSTGGAESDPAIQTLIWLFGPESISLTGVMLDSLPSHISYEYFGVWMNAYIQFGILGLVSLAFTLLPIAAVNPLLWLVLLLSKVKFTYPLIFILAAGVTLSGRKIRSPERAPNPGSGPPKGDRVD